MSDSDGSKLSKNEHLKTASQGLYGTVEEDINSGSVAFSEDNTQILKHHGTYQQDNRDTRASRKKAGLEKEFTMMVRTKTPGGRMTREQYILCDDLADKYGQHDLRITSRQGFQFHGVLKGNLRSLIHDLNLLQKITTSGACGDVVRNVMCSPVVDIDPRYAAIGNDLIATAAEISTHFLPQSTSYYDLWLNDERVKVTANGEVQYTSQGPANGIVEPIYGKTYLPRKFKIGIAVDFDNSIDVYTQDLGIIAVTERGHLSGFEILAGGGLGHSHSKTETYSRLGSHITFVKPGDLVAISEAIVKVQRDFGNREQRHLARLKYTIDTMGLDAFRVKVAEYLGKPLDAPRGIIPSEQPDFLGWHPQSQPGLHYVGVWVENGRVKDFDDMKFRTGLRKIVEKFSPSIRLTPHHNVILADIRSSDMAAVQELLDEHHIPTDRGISSLRRREMACPALPLCGLALSEAERELPKILHAVEQLGYADADVTIRMTGCPNSCARPETAEIGIIGRGPNKYNIYVGGDKLGTRMNALLLDGVTNPEVAPAIAKLLGAWEKGRSSGESFGDWSHRVGAEALREVCR